MDGYLGYVEHVAAESYAAGLTPARGRAEAPRQPVQRLGRDRAVRRQPAPRLLRARRQPRRHPRSPSRRSGRTWSPSTAARSPATHERPAPGDHVGVVTGHTAGRRLGRALRRPGAGEPGAARRRRRVPRDLEHGGRTGSDHRRRDGRADRADPRRTAAAARARGSGSTSSLPGHLDERGLQSPVHRTASIDYGIVLEGEITLVLDDSEVTLQAGDVVVQRGTDHAWANRGDVTGAGWCSCSSTAARSPATPDPRGLTDASRSAGVCSSARRAPERPLEAVRTRAHLERVPAAAPPRRRSPAAR